MWHVWKHEIYGTWDLGAEESREEWTMIAKLLGKLSFTRHYGAYGEHDWT